MDHISDPELPIIDPHHHLWDFRKVVDRLPVALHPFFDNIRRHPLYGFNELAADLGSGHNVIATVYVEAGTAYRNGCGSIVIIRIDMCGVSAPAGLRQGSR